MSYDRFMIAPYDIGLKHDTKPWMSPENAFEKLNNAYVWRGRIRKRFGARPMNELVDIYEQPYHTRLRVKLAAPTTAAGATGFGPVVTAPGAIFSQGQMFSVLDPVSGISVSYTVSSPLGGVQPLLTQDLTDIPFATTDNVGAVAGTAPGGIYAVGQQFDIGGIIFTTVAGLGPQPMVRSVPGGGVHTFNSATGAFVFTGEAVNTDIVFNRIIVNSGTFNTTTGALTLTNSFANADIYYYPSTPVMGLITYEQGLINNNDTFAFDQQFAYIYLAGAWERLGTKTWTGNDQDFFWGANWQGLASDDDILYVTNNVIGDNIQYWDGLAWTALHPQIDAAGTLLDTAKIIMVFQNYLVALDTTENGVNYQNRARWSQWGSPVDPLAWRSDIPGRGSFLDAPTKAPIISATIIKNHLIVYFDSATYELVYTNNAVVPFKWQQINSELGAQSMRSIVNFDSSILGIGTTGIHSCNGVTVQRIDKDIPDAVYDMYATEEGTQRTCSIRDYIPEMIYWSVPAQSDIIFDTSTYPNKILAYNYKTPAWSYFDDTITAFGYYYQQDARIWQNMTSQWGQEDSTWSGANLQSRPKLVMAGNHQGWTFLVDTDYSKNSMSLVITDINPATLIITCIKHNLPNASFVFIQNCEGLTDFNDGIYRVVTITDDTLLITLHPGQAAPVNAYTGNGIMTRVSQVSISTKQFNFYIKENRNTSINKVDFLVNNNPGGKISVECFPSYSILELVDSAQANGSAVGTGILDLEPYAIVPLENWQDQFWHPLYFMAEGESVQFMLFYSNDQIIDTDIAFANFQLQAMTVYAMPTSYHTL